MSNQRLLQAPEAAFTGYETDSRAQLFELLSDEFTFRHAPRHCLKRDLSDHTSPPTE
jgi:hypothetical protein